MVVTDRSHRRRSGPASDRAELVAEVAASGRLGPGGRLDRRARRADRTTGASVRGHLGPGPGRPAGGRRAPAVRARHLAVPDSLELRGRSAGAHPPARDRAGGGGGAGASWPGSAGRGPDGRPAGLCRPRDRLGGDRPVAGRRRSGHRPPLEVWATDASPDALAVARANLASLGRARSGRRRAGEAGAGARGSTALPGGWPAGSTCWCPIRRTCAEAEYADLDPVVRDWEPAEALVPAGTERCRRAWPPSRRSSPARPGGCGPAGALVVEIAPSQAYGGRRRGPPGRLHAGRDGAAIWPGGLRMLVAER